MIGAHDLGGRAAGPVDPSDSETFAKDWHARAMALTVAAGAMGQWTIDASRHARETLPDYARLTYYEKWIAALTDLLVRTGTVTRDELRRGAGSVSPLAPRRLTRDAVGAALRRGAPVDRPGPASAFSPGQRVRTRSPEAGRDPAAHTRLPAYVWGRTGIVTATHGCHVFPDTNAHGQGERPEPLYTVAFRASDLWSDADPRDEVRLDLWQSYLSPA